MVTKSSELRIVKEEIKKDYTKRETDFYAIKWQSSFLAAHYKYIFKILRTTA